MRLLIFGMPFLSLAAALAQGLRLMTVMATIPPEPPASHAAISEARAEIAQLRARRASAGELPLAAPYACAQDLRPTKKLVLAHRTP